MIILIKLFLNSKLSNLSNNCLEFKFKKAGNYNTFNLYQMSRNTLMMTTKTMIQVGLQLVLRISFCVLEVRTVFGRPGFVTTRTIVPAARTNPRKSVQIDLFVTKTCSGNILSYQFLHFTGSFIDIFLLFFPMGFYEIKLDLNSLTY